MRFLLVAALIAVATANPARFIVPGPAGPAPVVDDSGLPIGPVIVDEIESPISVGPVIIDESDYSPISVGPTIIDESDYSPISVGPAIIDESDYSPISVGPAIIDQVEPSVSSPLVQVIVNIKSGPAVAESPVVIEAPESIPDAIEGPEPSPVIVVDSPEQIIEQPIIDGPIFPSPAVVLPDALN